jgi:hypothetical protein
MKNAEDESLKPHLVKRKLHLGNNSDQRLEPPLDEELGEEPGPALGASVGEEFSWHSALSLR